MRTTGSAAGGMPWVRAMGALMTVVVLAACGSSTGTAASFTSSTTAYPTAPGPLTPAQLAVTLKASAKTASSAHIILSSTVGGQKVLTAEGDEAMAGGKLTSMRMKEKVGGMDLTFLIIHGTVFVKLPAREVKNGKVWVKATARSTDPFLRKLAASIDPVKESDSLSQYAAYPEAASSLRTVAVERLDGEAVTHYSMLVDVSKIHSAAFTEEMKKTIAKAGIVKVPVHLWVDKHDRTVKVAERFKVQGEFVSIDLSITRINKPVSIVAPSASQISARSGG
jgi:hypothetical protein